MMIPKSYGVMTVAAIILKSMIVKKLDKCTNKADGHDSEYIEDIEDLYKVFGVLNEDLEENGYNPVKLPRIQPDHVGLYEELLERTGIDMNVYTNQNETKEEL